MLGMRGGKRKVAMALIAGSGSKGSPPGRIDQWRGVLAIMVASVGAALPGPRIVVVDTGHGHQPIEVIGLGIAVTVAAAEIMVGDS